MTIAEALAFGVRLLLATPSIESNGSKDAELLLMHALRCERSALMAWPDRVLEPSEQAAYEAALELRLRATPIQYITGTQEFYGLPFRVTPAVLIPRPETEHLVESLLGLVQQDAPVRILDIGTGSGAIAVALAKMLPSARVIAADISRDALDIARVNAIANAVEAQIRFVASDLFAKVPAEPGSYDCIVSNPPYIADGDRSGLPREVSEYEPEEALFSGPSGYEMYAHLIPEALPLLRSGGWLLLEIGFGQQPMITKMFASAGYKEVRFNDDLRGIARVAIGRKA